MAISVEIEKNFGTFRLNVAFDGGNEIIGLLGASGCGKSMTLRCIAGIEKPDRGKIIINGATLFDSERRINLSPQERRTGLLFQSYALFPNMTVYQNIQAGARREKDRVRRARLTDDFIDQFGLRGLVHHYPHQLSGGQQQRTALARILVSSPDILLLDEPFSALDSHLRFSLEQEVGEIIRAFGKPVLLVSHDQGEVYRLSEKIAVIHNGAIETFGKKEDVFLNPRTKNAALLTGFRNISPADRTADGRIFARDWGLTLTVPESSPAGNLIAFRAGDLLPGSGENDFRARVVGEIENPLSYLIRVIPERESGPRTILWEIGKEDWRKIRSETVTLRLPAERIALLTERGDSDSLPARRITKRKREKNRYEEN